MFDKILIANRGEIACRVIDTCRRLGVKVVAVYSEADADARHVAMADEAVCIGPAASGLSYLDIGKVVAAAQQTGAQAVHPGYGFLSENPDFVAALEGAGITFIGPGAEAIRAMGLKDAAKARMEAAGVPVVPGYHGAEQDPGRLEAEAALIGYPVLIKAVAGGGGRGMRLVERAEAFEDALESARVEALGAFGNGDVLIEKFIEHPRHIEVQVFGDGQRAVHLFERDCSLQRRHQKVIEEAPAPGMTQEVRAAMGGAAVRAAKAIGYKGAGTVEFIVDGSGGLRPDGFWFMEMNTRLQVEHPVSEEITGVDLVEWQLRVAAGEPLPCAQEDLTIRGHAMEARLYAEDVPAGFLPATGRLERLRFGPGRVDTGVREGDVISPHYDPMIAKLTCHGATRAEARAALAEGLAATEVAGVVTNLGFLGRLIDHAGFRAGDVETGLIARDLEALTAPCTEPELLALAALAALGLNEGGPGEGFALWAPLSWPVTLLRGAEPVEGRISALGGGAYGVEIGGAEMRAERGPEGWRIDGRSLKARAEVIGGEVQVFGAEPMVFALPDPLEVGAEAAGEGAILAPMPGVVRSLHVRAGETVQAGDRLAVMEAMKMEHVMRAPHDGVVAELAVAAGDQLEAGALIVRIEAEA
ncbi:3-methylcrotonyl-CoA carboxylase [Oceanicola sp. D3]|uniref:acetyl/propionyl/methylcrotonyl-CoA carboxylase subunit alpha n=1 Tax=Oceanicola sp. D3 TaxID=2587163 RepID=UPI0011205B53|nr:biotin carboxylase N-terminal domain-containing protein [Oceanicola sp. D3]QDC10150.1 3-methylcrotonyl-CoA carboxylase [Oceanicola sp. D3]